MNRTITGNCTWRRGGGRPNWRGTMTGSVAAASWTNTQTVTMTNHSRMDLVLLLPQNPAIIENVWPVKWLLLCCPVMIVQSGTHLFNPLGTVCPLLCNHSFGNYLTLPCSGTQAAEYSEYLCNGTMIRCRPNYSSHGLAILLKPGGGAAFGCPFTSQASDSHQDWHNGKWGMKG